MNLIDLRKKIDSIDAEILKLLDTRFEMAIRAKRFKTNIHDSNREEKILLRAKQQSSNLLSGEFAEKLFSDIIMEAKRLQIQNLRLIGFQGEHGAYSEIAAKTYDSNLIPIPCIEFADVFNGVRQGYFDLGIVPVENSIEGQVTQVNDLLISTNLKVVGEVAIPIHHCLIALRETDLRDIKVAYSHPQALGQCNGFLERNKIEGRPFYNTAGAAAMLARERSTGGAVIASKLAAEIYDLNILEEKIEDSTNNNTRFLIISKEMMTTGGNKCSITFKTHSKTGSLFGILKIFAQANINLTRIESRTLRDGTDRVAFILDFIGSDKDENVAKAINQLASKVSSLNILGCYGEWKFENPEM